VGGMSSQFTVGSDGSAHGGAPTPSREDPRRGPEIVPESGPGGPTGAPPPPPPPATSKESGGTDTSSSSVSGRDQRGPSSSDAPAGSANNQPTGSQTQGGPSTTSSPAAAPRSSASSWESGWRGSPASGAWVPGYWQGVDMVAAGNHPDYRGTFMRSQAYTAMTGTVAVGSTALMVAVIGGVLTLEAGPELAAAIEYPELRALLTNALAGGISGGFSGAMSGRDLTSTTVGALAGAGVGVFNPFAKAGLGGAVARALFSNAAGQAANRALFGLRFSLSQLATAGLARWVWGGAFGVPSATKMPMPDMLMYQMGSGLNSGMWGASVYTMTSF
jgi:hypothetical protein